MSFDRDALAQAVAAHGAVVRVVVAEVAGSAPREAGAMMLVFAGGQAGTIGGGALEWQAAGRARAMLAAGGAGRPDRIERIALGPVLNQCCGGAVVLLSEVWDGARLAAVAGAGVIARPLPGRGEAMPLAVARIVARARDQGLRPAAGVVQGWMVEPVSVPRRALWIWGAGHVGRALVSVLAPLPDLGITWIDTDAARFPALPVGLVQRVAPNPGDLVAQAPVRAEHLVVSYSHALDLELCHRLLGHGFASLGLIGSATKWARFRSRLAALGHADARISRICCPIGDPGLGKHPQAIAVGVAAALLKPAAAGINHEERAG